MATVTRTKKSVVPIYLIGGVWLVYGAARPLQSATQIVVCGLLSVIAYLIAKAVFPDQTYTIEVPDQPKKPEKPSSTGNAEIDQLIGERGKAVSEMERLNASIQDPDVSRQIYRLELMTGKIIDGVVSAPQKLPQIRKFMRYYLPTTLKILNAYDRMAATGIEGENITATKTRVAGMLDTISRAFEKQLDSLYGDEALDISTDITVMEQMLREEGLGAGGLTDEERSSDQPNLQL